MFIIEAPVDWIGESDFCKSKVLKKKIFRFAGDLLSSNKSD